MIIFFERLVEILLAQSCVKNKMLMSVVLYYDSVETTTRRLVKQITYFVIPTYYSLTNGVVREIKIIHNDVHKGRKN